MNSNILSVLAGVIGGMEITIIIYIVLAIVLFLILREVACWYWKINERKNLMEEQNELLKELIELKKKPNESSQS